MDKNICIITATRAEYGLLSPIIKGLQSEEGIKVTLAVTGMHLSPEFGLTYKEIEADGIAIDKKIEILLSSDTPAAVSKTMALALLGFSEYFEELKPDSVMILGDRYEMLAVACAAMNARIPIIHLYGGEATEGLIDEAVRHSITKMSYLHLTSTEEYRKRVIQLGEAPERVYAVGSTGVENALHMPLFSKKELEKELGIELEKPFAVVTFHPVTLENNKSEEQFKEILAAFDANADMNYIFTKANSDSNGRIINKLIDEYAGSRKNAFAFDSLGMKRYLSSLKYAEMVIGNSSSGLVEVPAFGIPTINIGDRQKGRVKAESVVDCEPISEEISRSIQQARQPIFRQCCNNVTNPYGNGETTKKVIAAIRNMMENPIDLKKKFYDL